MSSRTPDSLDRIIMQKPDMATQIKREESPVSPERPVWTHSAPTTSTSRNATSDMNNTSRADDSNDPAIKIEPDDESEDKSWKDFLPSPSASPEPSTPAVRCRRIKLIVGPRPPRSFKLLPLRPPCKIKKFKLLPPRPPCKVVKLKFRCKCRKLKLKLGSRPN